jgi:hypothetical protein
VPAKENDMTETSCPTDLQNPLHVHIPPEGWGWQQASGRPARPRGVKSLRRWSNRTTGFVLGGVLLGAAGCLFGAAMPYEHPVGVTVSVFWWSIYFGCFGMNIGALLGVYAEQSPMPPSQG